MCRQPFVDIYVSENSNKYKIQTITKSIGTVQSFRKIISSTLTAVSLINLPSERHCY